MTKLVFFGLDEHEKDVIWKAFVGKNSYEASGSSSGPTSTGRSSTGSRTSG